MVFSIIERELIMAIQFLRGALGAVSCAAALLCAAPVMAQEPVQPITPAKITHPGQVELVGLTQTIKR